MKLAFRVAFWTVALASTLHCGKSPTEPLGGNASIPTPIPTPASGSLTGTWTGTFEDGSCSESIRMDLGHNGNSVEGYFTTHCVSPNGDSWIIGLNGRLQGSALSASLDRNDSEFAFLKGTASSTSIELASYISNMPVTRLRLSR